MRIGNFWATGNRGRNCVLKQGFGFDGCFAATAGANRAMVCSARERACLQGEDSIHASFRQCRGEA
jgi:hypothetical protein